VGGARTGIGSLDEREAAEHRDTELNRWHAENQYAAEVSDDSAEDTGPVLDDEASWA
jgi:hypothetical protein